MLWEALAAARDLGRLHDLAGILIRYGFGDVVRRIGLADALERAGRALHWRAAAELARLETACPSAARAGGDGSDFRQIGSATRYPRRPVRSRMDRRIQQASGQRAVPRLY